MPSRWRAVPRCDYDNLKEFASQCAVFSTAKANLQKDQRGRRLSADALPILDEAHAMQGYYTVPSSQELLEMSEKEQQCALPSPSAHCWPITQHRL